VLNTLNEGLRKNQGGKSCGYQKAEKPLRMANGVAAEHLAKTGLDRGQPMAGAHRSPHLQIDPSVSALPPQF